MQLPRLLTALNGDGYLALAHDVSDEARDDNGKWIKVNLKEKTQQHLAQSKKWRLKFPKKHPLDSVAKSLEGKKYARKNKKMRLARANKLKTLRQESVPNARIWHRYDD